MNGNADTFFGFPLDELTTENPRALRYLIRAWIAEHGTEPTDFDEDLEKLRPLFHSHVTGNRVRDRVKTLDRIPQSRPYIPDVFFLPIDSERGLVTPEGRALIETTRDNNSDPSPADAVAAVARFYGDSLRAWMAKSVETGLVPLPSVGFVIFLLINGSVGPERAMRFPSKQDEEADLARVVMDVASTFSSSVHGPAIKTKERAQLRTSWVVSQAVRHLGKRLTRDSDRRTGLASIWVEEEQIPQLLTDIAIAIHARGRATPEDVAAAFDAAVAHYQQGRVILGAWGISHERRRHTQQLREGLLEATYRVRV